MYHLDYYQGGKCFIRESEFNARMLLPEYFCSNNVASFPRIVIEKVLYLLLSPPPPPSFPLPKHLLSPHAAIRTRTWQT